jgi:type III pantothenate kinase
MNLVIDLGNTTAKLALFRPGSEIAMESKLGGHDFEKVIGYINTLDQPVTAAILSSVVDHPADLEAALRKRFHTIILDHNTPLPIKNRYATPATLGRDRLAVAVGGYAAFPGRDVLVIDAGTCIKYDMVTAGGEYLGGGISPGIEMRFRALNTFTDKLPLLHRAKTAELVGGTTQDSILSGVQNGVMEEVKGIITRYEERFGSLSVGITGGDLDFFIPMVSGKNTIFADPYLALKGLNFILEHNAS